MAARAGNTKLTGGYEYGCEGCEYRAGGLGYAVKVALVLEGRLAARLASNLSGIAVQAGEVGGYEYGYEVCEYGSGGYGYARVGVGRAVGGAIGERFIKRIGRKWGVDGYSRIGSVSFQPVFEGLASVFQLIKQGATAIPFNHFATLDILNHLNRNATSRLAALF